LKKISGPELVDLYKKQLAANGLEVMQDEVLEVQKNGNLFSVVTKSGKTYESVAVVVTSGAQSRLLRVPGEEKFAGKGVSYCSLCDGPVFKNKVVAVVGGGNNGFESALFLSNYVTKIYILEYSNEIKADKENQELVHKNPNIEVIKNAKVKKIEGNIFVNSVTYEDLIGGTDITLQVNGVFVEIGYNPSTGFLGNLVDMNDNKELMFDPKTLETKTPGLFSAGDCNVSKYKQIVMASGDGAKAALSAYEYVKRNKN
jgi:thioredoxin reductase